MIWIAVSTCAICCTAAVITGHEWTAIAMGVTGCILVVWGVEMDFRDFRRSR